MTARHIQRGNYASPAPPPQQIPVTTPAPEPAAPLPAGRALNRLRLPYKNLPIKKSWLKPALIALLIILLIWLARGYLNTRNELAKAKKAQASDQTGTEAERLVKQIGQNLQLPPETPTLATVTNVGKLQGQEFFKNAKNGDKVLIFQKSGRALLYRPSTQKIIEYSKVELPSAQQ